ncbi:MAG: amidohydrolase family protein [Gemmatimonadota bacterium]|nr:amidohydrolase family protein [Gemmatimonadota bacterium]MDH3423219.1 amidohydrolase family protein [Gemmatimonadota bacterium]
MTSTRALTTVVLLAAAAGCSPASTATAYTDLTLWDGTGAPALANAALVVDGGRVVSVVPSGSELPPVANTVSLAGKYVIPGLVEAHAHVSGDWAPDEVTSPEDRVREDLLLYARYGVTTVNSLGDGETVIAVRNAATPTDPRARLLAAGAVIAGSDPAAVRADAVSTADAGVDWLKLRVDDNLGATPKMPWAAVSAVMDVSRERNIPVASHLFYLEDAKRLLELGTGMLAHSVRDRDVDAAFISSLRASDVCYVPTLVREVSTFVYGTRPDWFDDPFFLAHADMSEVARVSEPAFMQRTAASSSAAAYRVALGQAQRNLKALSDAGIPIAMGTDAGPAGRFPGFFEHEELQLMVDAGLTPAQALRSATGVAAECLSMADVGTLEPGKWADFIVLGADPLRDIRNTRTLERVFVAGQEIE